MTFALSELQELGEFVPDVDARGRAQQALEEAERIARDEWGFPVIAGSDVGRADARAARRAVAACPALALRLTNPDTARTSA